VNKLPREFVVISARGVKPVVRSTTERYVGLRRDRGNFTSYVYSMLDKEFKAGHIPETWTKLKAKGVCTPQTPCNDCAHCALVAMGDVAALNGLITIVNRKGTKGITEDGRGYTTYYRLDEHTGVDEGLLDGILADLDLETA
jgi:hypothetical protein